MKTNKSNPTQQVARVFRKHGGMLRTHQALALGIHPRTLYALRDRGELVQVSRGLFQFKDAQLTEYHNLAIASKLIPKGVICLLSALSYHKLTTQFPFEVWLAVDRLTRTPKTDTVPMRIVRFSGQALEAGIEEHEIEGITLRVYNPAKTVADCFKFRNKIGLDVALEALREGWKNKMFTMDDLWRFGKICRVANVMRPYLELLAS